MHLARARYLKVLTVAEALDIANGGVGDIEFYRLFSDTPEVMQTEASLTAFAAKNGM